jgi:hypothetical protein
MPKPEPPPGDRQVDPGGVQQDGPVVPGSSGFGEPSVGMVPVISKGEDAHKQLKSPSAWDTIPDR